MDKLRSENKNYTSCTITPSIEYPVAQKGTDKGVMLKYLNPTTMIKKAAVLIFLIATIRIIISCCNGVDPGFNFNYSKLILTTGNKIKQNNVFNADTMTFEDLVVQIDFDYIKISKSSTKSYDLYAQDCRPIYEPEKKITNIHINTLRDFNVDYPKGSEIDVKYKIFGFTDLDFDATKDFVINNLNKKTSYEPELRRIYFKLESNPFTNTWHRFKITFDLNDNSVITDSTNVIFIKE